MNFSPRQKCHYETLGVPNTATMEEIKSAFRTLSLQTHPDIVGASVDPERFKSISHAASVLTNTKLKLAYDEKLHQHRSYYANNGVSNHFTNFHRQSGSGSTHHGSHNTMTPWAVQLFRPRNWILGPIAVFIGVSTLQYVFGIETNPTERNKQLFASDDKATMVQAWLNPQSGQYETPAPWDPLYRQLQPELQYVPRNQVQPRTPR